jgi:aryl-alcohol dehydrogenase-like predicted oxidoreductase
MKYALLGRTGVRVSNIALGTAAFGIAPLEEDADALVGRALDLGVNHFDTANTYGNQARFDRPGVPPADQRKSAEEILGKALRGRRHEAVIATKVQERVGPGPNDTGLSRRHILEQVEASLRRLGTDYIDIYYAHHPDPDIPIGETLDVFDGLIKQGKVRYCALSQYPAWRLTEAMLVAERLILHSPVALQVPYSLANRSIEPEIVPACLHLRLPVLAFSPLAGGLLSGTAALERPYVGNLRWGGRGFSEDQADLARKLDDLAHEAGHLPAQLALAWLLSRPAVCGAIIGAEKIETLEISAAATDLEIDPDLLSRLDELTSSTSR